MTITDPRLFNFIIMALYVLNSAWWAWNGKWGDASYWICAFGITASVTWGMQR
jgi:hypothetical protein